MNQTTKWTIILIIVVAVIWFGYSATQKTDDVDINGMADVMDTGIDPTAQFEGEEEIDPTIDPTIDPALE